MKFSVNAEGFEGQNLQVVISVWTGPKLLVNGETAPKGVRRGESRLKKNDGTEVTASWKQQFIGFDVPQLVLDGKVLNLVEPLKWYQWAWGGLPILLVFTGGALGAFAGIIGFSVNARIFRTKLNPLMQYAGAALVTALTAGAFFSVAALLFNQGRLTLP